MKVTKTTREFEDAVTGMLAIIAPPERFGRLLLAL